jgi:hypothetical protein
MALPTFNDLTGLDVSFNGEPFCNISTGTGSLDGLDTAYNGEPFSGTEAPSGGSNVEIQPGPGIITSSGVFAGINTRLPSAPGVIASSGVCGDIEIIESGNITPPAGIVTATGLLSGIRTELPSAVSRIDAVGICGSVATASIVKPAPGLISASGAVPWIGQKISPPAAQITCGADISGLLCVLTATPATGLVTGGVAGIRCVSISTGVQRRYECRIQCDGFDDIIVPVSAFQSRLHLGYPSYSEITIPGLQHFAEVTARHEGNFVVSATIAKGNEILLREDIFNAPIDKMTITGNQSLQHMVLSGTRATEENPAPQAAPLRGIVYRRLSYGYLSLRSAVTDLYLKPGDTVTYDGDSFTARTITHSFSPAGAFMEVRESDT